MEPPPTFPDLLRRCLEVGDEDSWTALVAYLQPKIAGVAARSALRWGPVSGEVVEDLTQEAFLKLCKDRFAILRKVQGEPEGAILAFVKVTVANLVHARFRADRSAKRYPAAGFLSTDALDALLGETRTMDALERSLLISEIDHILSKKIATETLGRDRTVFWLHHRNGMTAKAISHLQPIGLSEKGVESLLFRLTTLIREEFEARKGIAAIDTFK